MLGAKTYEVFLVVNGLLGTILIGTAVGTFFNGAQFSLNDMNQVDWQTPYRGLEAVLTFHNVALGLAVFFLSRVLGLCILFLRLTRKILLPVQKNNCLYNSIPFLVFFLYFLIKLLLKEGFAVNPETGEVFMEKYKYLHNFLQMPLNTVICFYWCGWGFMGNNFNPFY